MRENARSKADRLLLEGRVLILAVDRNRVRAAVRSDGAVYTVTAVDDTWHCPCAARTRCSHELAVMRVVATHRPPPTGTR